MGARGAHSAGKPVLGCPWTAPVHLMRVLTARWLPPSSFLKAAATHPHMSPRVPDTQPALLATSSNSGHTFRPNRRYAGISLPRGNAFEHTRYPVAQGSSSPNETRGEFSGGKGLALVDIPLEMRQDYPINLIIIDFLWNIRNYSNKN
jgi:hypothetical protein